MLNQLQGVYSSLHKHQVKYLTIRGIAAILYGVPRATFDLDILIEATPENAQRLLDASLRVFVIQRPRRPRRCHRPPVRLDAERVWITKPRRRTKNAKHEGVPAVTRLSIHGGAFLRVLRASCASCASRPFASS